MKKRLDDLMLERHLAASRKEAQGLIMSRRVLVDNEYATKPGHLYPVDAKLYVQPAAQYVSRGGLKLESVADKLGLDFRNKIVLDVGASTGGFTDFALQNGAAKVYAVDVGKNTLAYKLRIDPRVVAMEKTDIRTAKIPEQANIAVADVSFISLRLVLTKVAELISPTSPIVAMVKPQFESDYKTASMNNGVIKNKTIRRQILKDFEDWAKDHFVIQAKADSSVAGAKGNVERFYLLRAKG